MGRKDLENGSHQVDLNPSKRFFTRSEISKSAEFFFFPFIKFLKIIALHIRSWLHLNTIKLLHHTYLVGFISIK